MISIVYASTATKLFSPDELLELLITSRASNVQHGITGMLLYRGGNIIQAIEGEEQEVLQLYENIISDRRHKDVILLSKDPIKTRQFSDWHMGFKNIDQMLDEELEGFTEFLENDFNPAFFERHPTRAYMLLLNFRDIMR